MTQRMAQFSKVSYRQFKKDWLDTFPEFKEHALKNVENKNAVEKYISRIYDSIRLPERATFGSAGYDFRMPEELVIKAGDSIKIPTGIRCEMYDGWVLTIYPRSGQGFKYGIHMANTVCVIDSDYAESDNEGHIFIKLVNDSSLAKDIHFNAGDAFCQGIFLPFGVTLDDDVTDQRNGGMGSTGR